MDAADGHGNGGRTDGGMTEAAAVRAAAVLCAVGVDGIRLLKSEDPTEILMLQAVGREALRIAQQRDKSLAAEIANAVGRLFR